MFIGEEPKTLEECFDRLKKGCQRLSDECGYSDDYSVFNQPATEEEIISYEKNNNIVFPEDYKKFLRFSNGAIIMNHWMKIYGLDYCGISDEMVPEYYYVIGEQVGDVIELETGCRIGEHRGLWFHTIGQRKGMGFSGGPWFVVKKDVANNILYVSHGYNPDTAYKQSFPIHDMHWLTQNLSTMHDITFKIRHTPEYLPGVLEQTGENTFVVHAKEKLHGVAPGQFCVLYDKNHHRCLGSAEITIS